VPYTVFTVISSVLLAGVVGLLLVRALSRTGALSAFAAGRTRV
jgi:energy-coupling factor transport system substrate-specific component